VPEEKREAERAPTLQIVIMETSDGRIELFITLWNEGFYLICLNLTFSRLYREAIKMHAHVWDRLFLTEVLIKFEEILI
jgi:hypothetical protein